ncbi:MAG TPA: VanZ family protein [Candidatus Limnocylindrales bacterium]
MAFHDGQLSLIPGFFALFPAIPIGVWILRRGADRRWTILALLALIHIDLVIALTIFPIPIGGQEFYRQTRGMSEDNVVPFATIASQLTHMSLGNFRQLFGNAVALAPLGIYGPGLWPVLRDWRKFVLVAVAFGVGIELTQYAGSLLEGFTYRVTDIDDAMMNATGAVVAFIIWRSAQRANWLDRWTWIAELREQRPEPVAQ